MRLETSGMGAGRRKGAWGALAALLLLVVAAPALGVTVKSISLKDSNGGTQVIVEADAPINYHDFTLESPDRIVLDCPGATLAFAERTWAGRATEMGWGQDTGARIVVDLAQASSYGVSQLGNNIVLAVETPAPKDADRVSVQAEPAPVDPSDNRRMSLDVQGAEVQTVLRSLSEFSGKNIVASKEVKGQVTLRL